MINKDLMMTTADAVDYLINKYVETVEYFEKKEQETDYKLDFIHDNNIALNLALLNCAQTMDDIHTSLLNLNREISEINTKLEKLL